MCTHTRTEASRSWKAIPKYYLTTEISACSRHTGHVPLSYMTFYIACRDLGLSIFFSISQTTNIVIEETVSFYLISWCGYDKTRENKIIIHEHFRMFQEVIEQFCYIILHLLCCALLGLSGTGIKCRTKMRAGVLPLCLWPQKPNKLNSLKEEHSC